MKKQLFTLSFALCAAFGYSQATTSPNVFPATGNIGMGTTTPTLKLDVITPLAFGPFSSPSNLAYFGNRLTSTGVNGVGLFILNKTYNFPPLPDGGLFPPIVCSSLTSVRGTTNSAYIDFNTASTTNTTTSALTFGYGSGELMRINQNGKVRIGLGASDIKTPDGYKLFVEQGILTEKVKVAVKTTTDWADYVFAPEYKLMPLEEVAAYTKENNHLPNVPSATDMVTEGLDVAKMDAKLLEKIEELTLYLIEQNKQIEILKAEITSLKEEKK